MSFHWETMLCYCWILYEIPIYHNLTNTSKLQPFWCASEAWNCENKTVSTISLVCTPTPRYRSERRDQSCVLLLPCSGGGRGERWALLLFMAKSSHVLFNLTHYRNVIAVANPSHLETLMQSLTQSHGCDVAMVSIWYKRMSWMLTIAALLSVSNMYEYSDLVQLIVPSRLSYHCRFVLPVLFLQQQSILFLFFQQSQCSCAAFMYYSDGPFGGVHILFCF